MFQNKLVTKYLIKENLFSFLLVFSFSCLLFVSIDLIELIRRSSTKEIDLSILVKMALLHIPTLFPIILPGKSDSASMDMVVELLTHTGRSLPEIMMMMIHREGIWVR